MRQYHEILTVHLLSQWEIKSFCLIILLLFSPFPGLIVATAESKVSFFSWPRLKFHPRKALFNDKFWTNLLGCSSKCTVTFPVIMMMLITKAVITDLFLLSF